MIFMITFLTDIVLCVVWIDDAHDSICLLEEITNGVVVATCL